MSGVRNENHTILWHWEGRPGHESARLSAEHDGWLLEGTAAFAHEGRPCGLTYQVRCDPAWRTVVASVSGWLGQAVVKVAIEVTAGGRWAMNGEPVQAVEGCTDIDLNFSPATNLLPIRRLALNVGEGAEVRAAWLRFPEFRLEPLAQRYERLEPRLYRYESAGGFRRDLVVNEHGFVVDYPGIWAAEEAAG